MTKGSLHEKKTVKLGKKSKLGGRESTCLNTNSQPLNRFLKNAQKALKHIINTKTSFSFVGGVGLRLRKICLVSFFHLVYRENIKKNEKFSKCPNTFVRGKNKFISKSISLSVKS